MLLFPAFGLTINLATLFALILAIGIVVGDAVVVGENIARQREAGLGGTEAAIEGARRVFWPLVVAVGTTMLGVLPLLFLDGLAGQLLNVAPALLLVLAVSLIHAFLILPSHLAHGRNWSRWPMSAIQSRLRVGIDEFRDRTAVPAIGTAVRHPVWSLAIGLAIVVLSALAVSTGVVRLGGLGEFEVNTVEADITFPVGTPPAVTEAGARQLVRAAAATNSALPGDADRGRGAGGGASFPAPDGLHERPRHLPQQCRCRAFAADGGILPLGVGSNWWRRSGSNRVGKVSLAPNDWLSARSCAVRATTSALLFRTRMPTPCAKRPTTCARGCGKFPAR